MTLFPVNIILWLTILCTITPMPFGIRSENKQTLMNPNLVGEDELLTLRTLDRMHVQMILEHRPFLGIGTLNEMLKTSLNEDELDELFSQIFIPINLNSASRAEILLIPGVGKRLAHEFEEYRPYRSIAQFRREIGKYIDDDEVQELEKYVFVPVDLNTGTEKEILGIPGVGNRMLHEFLEYRPYKSLQQFRREIGKYVDDEELARLERYITVR